MGEHPLDRLLGYLERDPDNWNLRAEVFDAALRCGEREVARAQVERAVALRPDDAGWLHRRGVLLLATGQFSPAQEVFEGLIRSGSDAPVVRYNLAYALFCQMRFQDALDAVAPLRDSADDTGRLAWSLWLRCEHRLDRLAEALTEFTSRAFPIPHGPDTWGVASFIAFDAGAPEAHAWAERALRERPDQLEALATMGSLGLADQDGAAAAAWFERAVAASPSDGRSWSGLAFARMLQQRHSEALVAFEKAVAGMPDHVGTWLGFGWCQVFSRQPEQARGSFERALALDRNVAESHGALAVAHARLGDREAAQREIALALRLDPKTMAARYAEAILSGQSEDPRAMLLLSRRVLGKRGANVAGKLDKSLEQLVFGDSRVPPSRPE